MTDSMKYFQVSEANKAILRSVGFNVKSRRQDSKSFVTTAEKEGTRWFVMTHVSFAATPPSAPFFDGMTFEEYKAKTSISSICDLKFIKELK